MLPDLGIVVDDPFAVRGWSPDKEPTLAKLAALDP